MSACGVTEGEAGGVHPSPRKLMTILILARGAQTVCAMCLLRVCVCVCVCVCYVCAMFVKSWSWLCVGCDLVASWLCIGYVLVLS